MRTDVVSIPLETDRHKGHLVSYVCADINLARLRERLSLPIEQYRFTHTLDDSFRVIAGIDVLDECLMSARTDVWPDGFTVGLLLDSYEVQIYSEFNGVLVLPLFKCSWVAEVGQ